MSPILGGNVLLIKVDQISLITNSSGASNYICVALVEYYLVHAIKIGLSNCLILSMYNM